MILSSSTHRQNFINEFLEETQVKADESNMNFYDAAVRVVLQWLGYEVDEDHCIDNADRGIDAWVFTMGSDPGLDIFQVKTHKLNSDGTPCFDPFDVRGVSDLQRAKNFLLHEELSKVSNTSLQSLLRRWNETLHDRKQRENDSPLHVTLNLVIVGDRLTSQAQQEFDAFSAANNELITLENGVTLQFHVVMYTINDVIDRRWREKNRDWRDLNGQKKDYIELTPDGGGSSFISDNKNAIFYCKAIGLVDAFNSLGYQLFEPNVRAEIRKSKVNQAIRESIMYSKTRRDFRFLNNGVTIVCGSYRKPNPPQKQSFTVSQPGIINGLQTVVALHTAYHELSVADQKDFEENCAVLVRLLVRDKAVEEITDVVKATNNQNPMQARNLYSNNIEQVLYIHSFADKLGWFYEAKEGAWDAYREDPHRWRPRLNRNPKDFQPADRRKTFRRIDNHDLAQEWLSFLGYARVAVNEKKALFEETRYYDLIFKRRPKLHGFDYDFEIKRAFDNADTQSPDPSLMLVAHLSYEFARIMTLSHQENRRQACARLRLDPSLPKLELDAALSKDKTYELNQALNAMSHLFTEYVGFVLFRTFGERIHQQGTHILSNRSFASMKYDVAPEVTIDELENGNFEQDDVLVILWLIFVDTVAGLLDTRWGESYRSSSNKPSFIRREETRAQIYRDIQDMDSYMKRRIPTKKWSIGVEEGQGLFEFVKDCFGKNTGTLVMRRLL